MATILGGIAAIGILVLLGVAFLLLGDRWAERASTGHGDFFPTLHLLALAAALIGVLLAVLSFASDHPKKWLHLTIPVVFVAIVYGYALRWNKAAWIFLMRDIRARVRRKNAA